MKRSTLLLLCITALWTQSLASRLLIIGRDTTLFHPRGQAISVACPGEGHVIRVSDSEDECSKTAAGPSPVEIGFVGDNTNFTLDRAELRQYNFWCEKPGGLDCLATIVYDLSISKGVNSTQLTCSLRFSKTGEKDNTVPTAVSWKKNGLSVVQTVLNETVFKDAGDLLSFDTTYDFTSGGAYSCEFAYGEGRTFATELAVPSPLTVELLFEPSKEQYIEGEEVTVICRVSVLANISSYWV